MMSKCSHTTDNLQILLNIEILAKSELPLQILPNTGILQGFSLNFRNDVTLICSVATSPEEGGYSHRHDGYVRRSRQLHNPSATHLHTNAHSPAGIFDVDSMLNRR